MFRNHSSDISTYTGIYIGMELYIIMLMIVD